MGSNAKQRILDTATDLFYRRGFHATGVDRIVEEADVAKMTLYNHFSSKQELIGGVVENQRRNILSWVDEVLHGAGDTPGERLLGLFAAFENWLDRDDFRGCPFLKATAEYGELDDPPRRSAEGFKRALRERILRQLRPSGAERPAALSWKLFFLLEGSIATAHTMGQPEGASHAREAARRLMEEAGVSVPHGGDGPGSS